MLMLPPVVVMPVFVAQVSVVIVNPLLPPPELTVILVAAADAEIAEPEPRNVSAGVLTVSEVPLVMVSVFPEPIEIDPPVACELKDTEPEEVGVKV